MTVTRDDDRLRRRLGQAALAGMLLGGLLSVVPPGIALLAPTASAAVQTEKTTEQVNRAAFDIPALLAEVEWRFDGLPFVIETQEVAESQLALSLDPQGLHAEFTHEPKTPNAGTDAWGRLARARLELLAHIDGRSIYGVDQPQFRLRVVLQAESALIGARAAVSCGPECWRVFTATPVDTATRDMSSEILPSLAGSHRLCAGHHPRHGLIAECVQCRITWRQLLDRCREDGWEVIEGERRRDGLPALCRRADREIGIMNYSSSDAAELYLLIVEMPISGNDA